uniref:Dipeptidylpeptidase IV N-terminal domain-containing protein n=1 Tax=Timema shepardi TaxID=629360 RepID=A0A7R9G606_TIMSH|nr:unnamed protein product [Timema shepardi]
MDDLVYPGASEGHNWRSIVLSLLVIGLVIAGILTAIYLLGYVDELLYWSGRRMKLDEYLEGDLNPYRLSPTWVSHTKFVYQADDGGLVVLDTTNDTVTPLVTNHTLMLNYYMSNRIDLPSRGSRHDSGTRKPFYRPAINPPAGRQLGVKGYKFSSDLRYVLFRHNVKVVYRQTFTAHYTVYDVSNDHHIPIRLNDAPKVRQSRLQYVTWLGNTSALLLVAENDIYLRLSPSGSQDHSITETVVVAVQIKPAHRLVAQSTPWREGEGRTGGWGLRDWEREMIGNRSVSVFLVGERVEELREVTGSSKRHRIIATEQQLYN